MAKFTRDCSGFTMVVDKDALNNKLSEAGLSLSAVSRMIGKNHTYLVKSLNNHGAFTRNTVAIIEEKTGIKPSDYIIEEKTAETKTKSTRNQRAPEKIPVEPELFKLELCARGLDLSKASIGAGHECSYFSSRLRNDGYVTGADAIILKALYNMDPESYRKRDDVTYDFAKKVYVEPELLYKLFEERGYNDKGVSMAFGRGMHYISDKIKKDGSISELDAMYLSRLFGIEKNMYEDDYDPEEEETPAEVVKAEEEEVVTEVKTDENTTDAPAVETAPVPATMEVKVDFDVDYDKLNKLIYSSVNDAIKNINYEMLHKLVYSAVYEAVKKAWSE